MTALSFERVSYTYPSGSMALREVDLFVTAGEKVALLGENGAGKSTLMLHSNGILAPDTGTVSVEGIAITKATVRSARSKVGLVFQDPDDQLFMASVAADIDFGPRNLGLPEDEVLTRRTTALEAVSLSGLENKPGADLSWGQRKRAALATVLSMRPSIMVLDEPTSNLDPRARRSMKELLAGLDTTLLIATHDMDLAWELCERVVVMQAGRIVADGPRDETLIDEVFLESVGLEVPHAVRARL